MHKSYHSFLTGVMDPLIGNCVCQLLTTEDLSVLPTACIYLLFMVLRTNSDYFANNVAYVMESRVFIDFCFIVQVKFMFEVVKNGQVKYCCLTSDI